MQEQNIVFKNDPQLSVIMPCFNVAETLNRALDSVLMQKTNFLFEIIIIDDFSSDETRLIAEQYARKDSRIVIIHNEENLGNAKSFYIGLSAARGDYFCVLDGDDYYSIPDKFQRQMNFFDCDKKSEYVATCHYFVFDLGGEDISISPCGKKDEFNFIDFISQNTGGYYHTSTYMYRNIFKGNVPSFLSGSMCRGDTPRTAFHLLYSNKKVKVLNFVGSCYYFSHKGIWSGLTEEKQFIYQINYYNFFKEVVKTEYEKNAIEKLIGVWQDRLNKVNETKLREYQGISLDSCLVRIRDISNTYAFSQKDYMLKNIYYSEYLDSLCSTIGTIFRVHNKTENIKINKKNIAIVIGKLVPEGGGIYKEICELISFYPDKNVQLYVTNMEEIPEETKELLTQFPNLKIVIPPINSENKLSFYMQALCDFSPIKTYFYCSHNDPISVALVQPGRGENISLFSFDHGFILGLSNPYLDFMVAKRPVDYKLLCPLLAKKLLYIPTWSNNSKKDLPEYVPFKNHDKLISATSAARFYKVDGASPYRYIDFLVDLLENTRGFHYHIGPFPEDKMEELKLKLKQKDIPENRFINLPWVDNLSEFFLEKNVDVFIEPFPIVSYKITLEMLSAGIPVISFQGNSRLSIVDFIYPEALKWRDKDEFIGVINSINSEILNYHSNLSQKYFNENHNPNKISKLLKESKSFKIPTRVPSFTDDCIVDVRELGTLFGESAFINIFRKEENEKKELELGRRKKAEEEKKKLELERIRKIEEDRKKVEEDRKKVEEDRKKVEEEKKKLELERIRKAEEEKKKLELERIRKAEEEKKKLELERIRKAEEEKKKLELERIRKAEEEKKKLELERIRIIEEQKAKETFCRNEIKRIRTSNSYRIGFFMLYPLRFFKAFFIRLPKEGFKSLKYLTSKEALHPHAPTLEEELRLLLFSASWKFGRFMTAPVRLIKNKVQNSFKKKIAKDIDDLSGLFEKKITVLIDEIKKNGLVEIRNDLKIKEDIELIKSSSKEISSKSEIFFKNTVCSLATTLSTIQAIGEVTKVSEQGIEKTQKNFEELSARMERDTSDTIQAIGEVTKVSEQGIEKTQKNFEELSARMERDTSDTIQAIGEVTKVSEQGIEKTQKNFEELSARMERDTSDTIQAIGEVTKVSEQGIEKTQKNFEELSARMERDTSDTIQAIGEVTKVSEQGIEKTQKNFEELSARMERDTSDTIQAIGEVTKVSEQGIEKTQKNFEELSARMERDTSDTIQAIGEVTKVSEQGIEKTQKNFEELSARMERDTSDTIQAIGEVTKVSEQGIEKTQKNFEELSARMERDTSDTIQAIGEVTKVSEQGIEKTQKNFEELSARMEREIIPGKKEIGERINIQKNENIQISKDLSKRITENTDSLARIFAKSFSRNSIEHLDFHLTEHCNLNCKGCSTFSPLAKEVYADVDDFEKDISKLHSIIGDKIQQIHLLGGEPLLHPHPEFFVEIARRYFKYARIDITTNGLLVNKMEENFWRVLRENQASIKYSVYPINLDYKNMVDYIRSKGVDTFSASGGKTINVFRKIPLNVNGIFNTYESYARCPYSDCTQLYDGKLYRCPASAFAFILNDCLGDYDQKKRFVIQKNDFIDLHSPTKENDIFSFLSRAVPFCQYCDQKNISPNVAWELSKCSLDEWLDINALNR